MVFPKEHKMTTETLSVKAAPVEVKQVQAVEAVPEPVPEVTPQYVKLSTVGFDARFPNQNQVKIL